MNELVSLDEAVSLGAVDSIFYSHFFFPKTVRQGSPEFHRMMWESLDGPSRLVSFMVFRGGAKTTLLRIYTSKRIAYTISRTILYVGKSQDHARRSVEWLMRQVEFNRPWAEAFGIQKGNKWTTEEIEILVGQERVPVRVIALGITGSTRGINVDDYRPDLIIVDDPSDEENTATTEQREKTEDFILGSLKNSLAPRSEAPLAKMAFLQTLLHEEDAISKCDKDPSWESHRISIFRPDGNSSWPERWSTDELVADKESYIARGKLSLWMREMECQVVASSLASFPASREQVRFYEVTPPPGAMVIALSVDPVPPPSDRELQEGLKRKDEETWTAVGLWKDFTTGEKRIYVLEQQAMKGHSPDWSIRTFLEMKRRWNPDVLKVESVNYQRTLKWLLEKEMQKRGEWMRVDAHIPEKRKKSYRIVDTIGAALADGVLYFHRSQAPLLEQIYSYPFVSHDDRIEGLAVAVDAVMEVGGFHHGTYEEIIDAERELPELPDVRLCP